MLALKAMSPQRRGDVSGMADVAFDFDHFIALDRQSIRLQLVAGTLLVLVGALGLLGAFTAFVQSGAPNVDLIAKGVGVVTSLVGLFPFNNCWSRWERIKTLRSIRLNPTSLDPSTEQELLRKLYAKFLGV